MDFLNNPNNEFKITKYWGEMINFVSGSKRICDNIIRKPTKILSYDTRETKDLVVHNPPDRLWND